MIYGHSDSDRRADPVLKSFTVNAAISIMASATGAPPSKIRDTLLVEQARRNEVNAANETDGIDAIYSAFRKRNEAKVRKLEESIAEYSSQSDLACDMIFEDAGLATSSLLTKAQVHAKVTGSTLPRGMVAIARRLVGDDDLPFRKPGAQAPEPLRRS
jgi:hypothetical protein